MSGDYKKRTMVKYIYNPSQTNKFKISRSRLENFTKCARCFYIDRKLGVDRPEGYPFTLNVAVDELLKKEFDTYREKQEIHPLCLLNNIKLVPFKHEKMEEWQDSLHKGIQYDIPNTNLTLTGGIDDAWINTETNEIFIADYKATSTKKEVTLDDEWKLSYKRQAEIYQWLFRKNGFKVSNTYYFVYANGDKSFESFNEKLHFKMSIISYEANDSWVEKAILDAYECLQSNSIPPYTLDCGYCNYIKDMKELD